MTRYPAHEEVLVTLRRIIRGIDLHSKKLVQDHGLTGPQLVLLKELGQAGEIAVGRLARRVNLSHGTVTGILDRLEKRNLISRTRSAEDKRQVLVRIAEEGRQILATRPSLVQEAFASRFQQLAAWEQTLILSSLQRVSAMMGTEDIDASSIFLGEPLTASTEDAVEVMSTAHAPEPDTD